MNWTLWRLLRLVGVAAVVLSVGAVLGLPFSSRAQQRAPQPTTVAASSNEPASPGPDYVGAETCKACHEDKYNSFSHTKMGRLFLHQPRNASEANGCENCHGPGKAHVDAGGGKGKGGLITFAKNDPTPVEKRNAVCLSCHNKGDRLFWQGSPHESRDVACTNCHRIMEKVSPRYQLARETVIDTCGTCHIQKRAQTMRTSHMPLREGKMTCTSCHNPHGTVTESLLKAPSLNDVCFNCHAEKRGPFLWNHPPQIESCANCHDPHGSNHENLLKVAKPRLCQQCHDPTFHPTRPYGPANANGANARFVRGQSCLSCHVNIHGSNHPAGFAFTR
jgi:DmsE family decaheme c-type cytochrome